MAPATVILHRSKIRNQGAEEGGSGDAAAGGWRPELLFVLQQEVDMYDIYQKRITECDQRLQKQLASLTHPLPVQPPTQKPKTKKPAAKNAHASISAANCSVSRAWTSPALTA